MVALLLWQLQHGATAEINRATLLKRGAPIPAFLTPPDVPAGYQAWIYAFWELSTERLMPGGPIPVRAIRAEPVATHEKGLFHRVIRALDRAYLEYHAPKNEGEPVRKLEPGMIRGKG